MLTQTSRAIVPLLIGLITTCPTASFGQTCAGHDFTTTSDFTNGSGIPPEPFNLEIANGQVAVVDPRPAFPYLATFPSRNADRAGMIIGETVWHRPP